MDEVQSLGGPLICVERRLANQWRGVDGLSVQPNPSMPGARTDYDCLEHVGRHYLSVIRLRIGNALILGDVPMLTGVLKDSLNRVIVWRVLCANHDDMAPSLIASLDEESFANSAESIEFAFNSPKIVIFDSALPGEEKDAACVSFEIEPGRYLVTTHPIRFPSEAELVLHRFSLIR